MPPQSKAFELSKLSTNDQYKAKKSEKTREKAYFMLDLRIRCRRHHVSHKLVSTAIGLKAKDGVVLAIEKRVTLPPLEPCSVEKIMEIDEHIGCAMGGPIADARTLVEHARVETQVMGGSTGIGNFGRLKTQKVQAFARRSAHLKREGSSRTSITQPDESSFADFDEQESNFERAKIVSGSARHANLNSNSRDEKTSGAHSLNSVLRQYRGDDDLDFPGSEATSGSKGWSNIADVTYGRQNPKQKGP